MRRAGGSPMEIMQKMMTQTGQCEGKPPMTISDNSAHHVLNHLAQQSRIKPGAKPAK
jgi:hypothetical protein